MNNSITEVEKEILAYIAEARKLLPGLSDEISIVWNKNLVIPGNGTGGSLFKPSVLAIGYDPEFDDKEKLSKHLRATVLHECFHSVQGWSDEEPLLIPKTLLEDGVLEGAATVFERDIGQTSPPWAHYENDETMHKWLAEIKSQRLDPNSDQYANYKFGNVHGVNWMLYKVGTWVADRALAKNPQISNADLATKKPEIIIELSGIELK